MYILKSASDQCIPRTKAVKHGPGSEYGEGSQRIPGWNDYVEPLRKEALLWHHEWKASVQGAIPQSSQEGHKII